MNRNSLILLLIVGGIVSIIGFFLKQYLVTIIFITLVLLILVVPDFINWYKSRKTNITRIAERLDALEEKKQN
jgi:uncharacterized membrane protein